MAIPTIIAFGACSPERPGQEPNTNVLLAAISNPPLRNARSLDGTLDVFFDAGDRSSLTAVVDCSKIQEISYVPDPQISNVEVQRMGFDPNPGNTVAILTILIQIAMLRNLSKMLRKNEKRLEEIKALIERREAVISEFISDQCAGIESIQLGVFPVDGNQHAAYIIMDAPKKDKNIFISSFPPELVFSEFAEFTGLRELFENPLRDESPFNSWNRGEYPRVKIKVVENIFQSLSTEHRKHIKTLKLPSGVAVHDYAVGLAKEAANCLVTKFPLTATERERGPIWYSNRILTTILAGAGGETAKNDVEQFLKELHMVSLVSNIPERDSMVVPGLGEPFSSPSHVQNTVPGSQGKRPRGRF